MDKELCFKIENQNLYLEQVLVDYIDVPIFFLCKDETQYYIALCTDIDELSYIVTILSLCDVYNLLHGEISMRNVILKQKEYWEIASNEEICRDVVIRKGIESVDTSVLPEVDACFRILTKQMEQFVQKFDNDFFSAKYFSESNQKVDLCELDSDFYLDILKNNIKHFTGLVDCKVEGTVFSNDFLYDEKMYSLKKSEVTLKKSVQSKQAEMDVFKLNELCLNSITVAA